MEMIDILNNDGTSAGFSADRDHVHTEGLWHAECRVWVVNNDNMILLQRRAFTKDVNPGMWSVSGGGHIDAGESPVVGTIRELEEEIGIKFKESDMKLLDIVKLPESLPGWINNAFYYIYVVHTDKHVSYFSVQPEEVEEVKYFSLSEVENMVNNEEEIDIDSSEFDLIKNYINKKENI